MAVVSCNPIDTKVSPSGSDGGRSYTSHYRVITDAVTDGIYTVSSASGLPSPYASYVWQDEYDLDAFREPIPDISVESAEKSRRVWIVTIKHSTRSYNRDGGQNSGGGGSPDGGINNPLDEPWEIDGDSDEWQDEAKLDRFGDRIVNSSLEPITGEPVTVIRNRRRLRLRKNLPSLDQMLIEETEGHINSQSIIILNKVYPAKTLLLRRITYSRKWHGTTPYYPHAFEIDHQPETFDIEIPDEGLKAYVGTDPTNPEHYSEILDLVTLNPVREPLPLDGSGGIALFGGQGTTAIKKYPTAVFQWWNFPQ